MYKANLSKASVNSILTLPLPRVDLHKTGMNNKTDEKLGEKPFPQY